MLGSDSAWFTLFIERTIPQEAAQLWCNQNISKWLSTTIPHIYNIIYIYIHSYTIDFCWINVTSAGCGFRCPLKDGTNDIIGIWDGQRIRIQSDTDHVWWAGAKAVLRCSGDAEPCGGFHWFPRIGVPASGWFIMEHPIKMSDFEVPLFQETSISHMLVLVYLQNWVNFRATCW